jgi:uncharacterized protein YbdZ (MbtH family)
MENPMRLDTPLDKYTSLFDERTTLFFVLSNELKQNCLWPSLLEPPKGWIKKLGPAARDECLSQIKKRLPDSD